MNLKILGLILLFFTSICPQTINGQDKFLLSKDKVGEIEIGMTIDALHTKYEPRLTRLIARYPEGMFSPVLGIYINGQSPDVEPSITVTIDKKDDWIVGSIYVKDKRFRTLQGIGIGSTLSEVRKAYKLSSIDFGEGPLFANVDDLGMSFELDFTQPSDEWYRTRQQSLISNSAKVVSVFVYDALKTKTLNKAKTD